MSFIDPSPTPSPSLSLSLSLSPSLSPSPPPTPSPTLTPVSTLATTSRPLDIPVIRIKSRSGSACSATSESSMYSSTSFFSDSNESISSPRMETFTEFQVVDNPTDANTATKLVSRARLEELEYINENISSIIEKALKVIKT